MSGSNQNRRLTQGGHVGPDQQNHFHLASSPLLKNNNNSNLNSSARNVPVQLM